MAAKGAIHNDQVRSFPNRQYLRNTLSINAKPPRSLPGQQTVFCLKNLSQLQNSSFPDFLSFFALAKAIV
jgi:hypothetical protein